MENFRHAFDMESYVYYTQVMQAETLAAAYRQVVRSKTENSWDQF